MNCISDDLAIQFIEGQLDQRRQLLWQQHINQCPQCQRLIIEYENLYEGLKQFSSIEPEDGFTIAVMANLPELNFQRQWQRKVIVQSTALIVVLLTSLAYLLYTINGEHLWEWLKFSGQIIVTSIQIVSVVLGELFSALEVVLKQIEWVISLLPTDSRLLFIISLGLLIAHTLFLKYFILKPEWRS